MSTSFEQGSARIYQFPAGGRAALGGHRSTDIQATQQAAPSIQTSLCSGSWYHEEAIQDAKPAWDR